MARPAPVVVGLDSVKLKAILGRFWDNTTMSPRIGDTRDLG